MAIILPHGVLFRGGAEEKIRTKLLKDGNIDAVIGLPANLFFSTGIPVCILVLKKCRQEDDNILFIDASREFEKVKTQNKLRPEHIQKIIDTYRNRSEIDKYSHCVTLQEIAENDYNISVSSYVEQPDTREEVDIDELNKRIAEIVARQNVLRTAIDAIVATL